MADSTDRKIERRVLALEIATEIHPQTADALISAARQIEEFINEIEEPGPVA